MKWVFVVALCLWSSLGDAADDMNSGSDFLPACKTELNGPADSLAHVHNAGICYGVIEALITVEDVLPPALRFCVTDGTTTGKALRVAVAYLESKPDRRNESFVLLSLEAFAQAWPCKQAK
jgi:hypothetical protein